MSLFNTFHYSMDKVCLDFILNLSLKKTLQEQTLALRLILVM